ncbi:hypothetical protein OIU74_021298 [Salix koriyanagi]|uniref:Uncharacterized protein n=1 Tax=Salix koriyanagi TaxID=2511006 RepID=A0A9Q0SMU2_9ROSI|nr:hypothetical protein OIU74_021298 [Salix koriyanagi]
MRVYLKSSYQTPPTNNRAADIFMAVQTCFTEERAKNMAIITLNSKIIFVTLSFFVIYYINDQVSERSAKHLTVSY